MAVKFVLNKAAFRSQVLQGAETAQLLEGIADAAAPASSRVVVDQAGPRARARIYGDLSREGSEGDLSRALGEMRL